MRLLCTILLCNFFVFPLVAQDFDETVEISTYDEDYRLYDRNEHGLDWNRYNYPEARRHRGSGYGN